MSLVNLRNITLGFGAAPLLDGVNFAIEKGERISLVGRNGSGKSTLMKLIAGELKADDGELSFQQGIRSGISCIDGDDLASQAVKSKIKQIIGGEDARKPMSDQKIASILKEGGIEIARRTVAKYREQMGILSSSKRKQLF